MIQVVTLVNGWGYYVSLSELQEMSEDEIAHLANTRAHMLNEAFKR
jgi:hypothetical protein